MEIMRINIFNNIKGFYEYECDYDYDLKYFVLSYMHNNYIGFLLAIILKTVFN